jgi:glycosyltransferase involved in cell wall biosynthesis
LITIALVMIVKNEEKSLKRCIDSVKNLVDEIIIVDTGSTDNTKQIAFKLGAKVFDYVWDEDFSKARNFSISKSKSDWNLVLDADEYILSSGHLIREFSNTNVDKIGRLKIISSYRENGEERHASSFVSRLFPNKEISFEGRVHEQLNSNLPRENLNVSVGHEGYYQMDKTDRNLPLLLKELETSPNDAYFLYQVGKQYYLKKNYIEANIYFGLSFSVVGDHAYFKPKLVVDYLYSCLRSREFESGLKLIEKEKANLDFSSDFHFACGVFFMELILSNVNKYISYLPNIKEEYVKCIKIGEEQGSDHVLGTGSYLALYNLGAFYEASGNIQEAVKYYQQSKSYGYKLAENRLEGMNKTC